MGARRAALLALSKMALVDGRVSDDERHMLATLLGPGESVEELLSEAETRPLHEIVARLDRYADRFFVALRSATIARIDADLDAREEALYSKLVELLAISDSDRALIERSVEALDDIEPAPPDPRIAELYKVSSFA